MSASVSTVLAFGLLLTACGGSGEEGRQVAQKCDGSLSSAAVGALETVLGTKEFQWGGTGLERTAKALIDDQAVVGRAPGVPPMCKVAPAAGDRFRIDVHFQLYQDADLYDDGTKWTAQGRHLYGMGRETSTDNKTARVFVECSGPQLKGSDKEPALVEGLLEFDKPIKGAYPANTPATREAYLTVLHSVTLAVVKKLGCEDDAGLPEKPVFEERKWRGEQYRPRPVPFREGPPRQSRPSVLGRQSSAVSPPPSPRPGTAGTGAGSSRG
ncbi:hypothetical protein [Streptomyces sp. R44]|uniref:Lipoprotein n=1 Tax=Streptomyces sp. R44 TaxID=3238633 RepID=A0AB39SZI9_9ACTN